MMPYYLNEGYYGGMGNMMGYGFGGNLMMFFVWAFIIVFVIWVVKEISGRSRSNSSGERAIDILKERYAKGEIDKHEFETKKKDLQ